MINYNHFTLDNGLEVYVIEDHSTPMAAVNVLYNVGSRDEDENKTGFAHLFEHLMFGGSKNIPNYDAPLQRVGAENNAFTSADITNYYITLPATNIETAFWLESDRMMSLSFDPKVLDVQRKVVIEEFKQRYLNQPYGDVWLKLRPLAYKTHPYRWATIGKEVSHIENATLDDVKDFFGKFYIPNNATLVVAGNVSVSQVKSLCKKWFEPIATGKKYIRNVPQEATQNEVRYEEISSKVPLDAIYKVFKMPGRFESGFHTVDLLGDVLGRGKSSILYQNLVRGQQLFNNLSASITASLDTGLLVFQGNINKGTDIETAEKALNEVLEKSIAEGIEESQLNKVKNQSESSVVFSEIDLLSRTMNLAFAANAGNADWVNDEASKIQRITSEEIKASARQVLRKENSSTLVVRSK